MEVIQHKIIINRLSQILFKPLNYIANHLIYRYKSMIQLQKLFAFIYKTNNQKLKTNNKKQYPLTNQLSTKNHRLTNSSKSIFYKNGQHMQRQQHIAFISTYSNDYMKIRSLQYKKFNNKHFSKRNTISNRFNHEVQKLKSDQNNVYKLILAVQEQRQQVKTILCKFLFSYADMQMTQQYQFKLEDMTRFPIMDPFQQQNTTNPQIYHKISTYQNKRALLKYYNFKSFNDYQLKKALYQISLYQSLKSSNPLLNYFIIYKGQIKQLVMIFKYSYLSLHDILMYRHKTNHQWDQKEILLIAKMLIESYKDLERNGIVHRDIRPSKVFLSPLGSVGIGGGTNTNPSHVDAFQQYHNSDRFYQFVNLQSSRFFDNDQLAGTDDRFDLITIKGVPTFNQPNIKQALQNQNHKINYNPLQADFAGLKNTILSLANLQPTNIQKDSQVHLKTKPKIKELIKYMQNNMNTLTSQKLDNYVSQLLQIKNSSGKTSSYYSYLKQFYFRQLTIAQNIELNLYFNSPYTNENQSAVSQLGYNDSSNQISNNNNMNSSSNTMMGSSTNRNRNPIGNNLNSSINIDINGRISNAFNNNFGNIPMNNNIPQQITTYQQPQYFDTVRDFIENLYVKTLYELQKKDVFVPYMLQKLTKNFQNNKRYQNVKLLLQVGNYFEDSGVRENQYYKEAIALLLQLGQEERIQGFYKDHNKYIVEAEDIFRKFKVQDSKAVSGINSKILKQKAYRDFYSINNQRMSQNAFSRQYVPYQSDRGRIIRKNIDQAILLGQKSNLPFQQQLQLLYAKAQLSFLMQNLDQSQAIFQKGYQIIDKNFKQFKTRHDNNKYKGMFQYGIAIVQLQNIMIKRLQKQAKFIFNIQEKLQKAKQRFGMVNLHPIYLVKCYVAMGDLNFVKQDVQNSKKMYQRALNLIHAENLKQSDSQRAISAKIELDVVEKLINVLVRSNYENESMKYQKLRDALKKQIGRPHKDQRRYSRSGKQRGSMRQSSKHGSSDQRQQMRQQLPIITQQQQQNKVFQSRRRPLENSIRQSQQFNNPSNNIQQSTYNIRLNNPNYNNNPMGYSQSNNMMMNPSYNNNNTGGFNFNNIFNNDMGMMANNNNMMGMSAHMNNMYPPANQMTNPGFNNPGYNNPGYNNPGFNNNFNTQDSNPIQAMHVQLAKSIHQKMGLSLNFNNGSSNNVNNGNSNNFGNNFGNNGFGNNNLGNNNDLNLNNNRNSSIYEEDEESVHDGRVEASSHLNNRNSGSNNNNLNKDSNYNSINNSSNNKNSLKVNEDDDSLKRTDSFVF